MNLFSTTLESISKDTPLKNRLELLSSLFPTLDDRKAAIRQLGTLIFGPPREVTVALWRSSLSMDSKMWHYKIPQYLYRVNPFTFWMYSPEKVQGYEEDDEYPPVFERWRFHPYFHVALSYYIDNEGCREFALETVKIGPLETVEITTDNDIRYWERVTVVPRNIEEDEIPTYSLPIPLEEARLMVED